MNNIKPSASEGSTQLEVKKTTQLGIGHGFPNVAYLDGSS